jgi:hypothetical protein
MKLIVGIFIVLACIGCISCNKQTTCLQDARIVTNVKFTTLNDTLAIIDTTLPKPMLVSDAIAFVGNKNTRTFSFLNNSQTDSMTFLFVTDSANIAKPLLVDTVQLVYTRQLNFVSKECGYNYYYNLLSITSTKNVLKKVSITQPLINNINSNATHLSFLF